MLYLRYDLLGFPPAVRYVGFWTQKWEKDGSYVGTYITRPPKKVTVFLDTNRIARNVWNIIFFFGMPYEFSTILNMHMRSVSDQIHLHILNFKTPFSRLVFKEPWKHHGTKIHSQKNPAFPPIIQHLPPVFSTCQTLITTVVSKRQSGNWQIIWAFFVWPSIGHWDLMWVPSEDSASAGWWHTPCKTGCFWRFGRFFLWEYHTMITSKDGKSRIERI